MTICYRTTMNLWCRILHWNGFFLALGAYMHEQNLLKSHDIGRTLYTKRIAAQSISFENALNNMIFYLYELRFFKCHLERIPAACPGRLKEFDKALRGRECKLLDWWTNTALLTGLHFYFLCSDWPISCSYPAALFYIERVKSKVDMAIKFPLYCSNISYRNLEFGSTTSWSWWLLLRRNCRYKVDAFYVFEDSVMYCGPQA